MGDLGIWRLIMHGKGMENLSKKVCGTYVVHHFNGTELCCTPLTCVVHHRPTFWTTNLHCAPWCTRGTYFYEKFCTDIIHFDGAQCRFVLIRWYTRQFVMYVIWLGGAHDSFSCTLCTTFLMVHNVITYQSIQTEWSLFGSTYFSCSVSVENSGFVTMFPIRW